MLHNFRLCSVFQTTPCPSSARVAVNSTITKINILNIFASSGCAVLSQCWWQEGRAEDGAALQAQRRI